MSIDDRPGFAPTTDGVAATDPGAAAGQSRRAMLCGLAVTALASGALVACGTASGGDSSAAQPSTTPGTPLAKLSDVPVGGGKLVDLPGGTTILLLRPTADVVHAVDPTCPHAGGQLGTPQHGLIVCPLHGSEFDGGTGALRQGPATRGLTQIPVKVQSDQVVAA